MRRAAMTFFLLMPALALQAAGLDDANDLKALYSRSCAVCHGEDGSGRGPNGQRLGGKDLASPRWQARTRDSQMVAAILKGKGAMPAFGAQMTEAQALQLVTEVIRPMAAKKH